MSARENYRLMQRLRYVAADVHIPGPDVARCIEPFIDRWRVPRVPRKHARSDPLQADIALDFSRLKREINHIGRSLRQGRVRGISFHRLFQKSLAELAQEHGFRGWTECPAAYTALTGKTHRGRIDVLWSAGGVPAAIFEIDREVKPGSFWKLKQAAVPHKFWIYFGRDMWELDGFLRKHDPEDEVNVVKIIHRFVPHF